MVSQMYAVPDKDGNDVVIRMMPNGLVRIGGAEVTAAIAQNIAQIIIDSTRPRNEEPVNQAEDWRANQQRRVERLEGQYARMEKLLYALGEAAVKTTGAGAASTDMIGNAIRERSINDLRSVDPIPSGNAINMLEERGPMQMPSASKRGYEGTDEVGGLAGVGPSKARE